MRRRELEELAERIAALEAMAGAGGGQGTLEARLEAIEDAVRRLGGEEGEAPDVSLRWCEELVSAHVPAGAPVAVATEAGRPRLAVDHVPVIGFGEPELGTPPGCRFEDGVAAIAALEAGRSTGTRFLLIPEAVRTWLERLPELREHLRARYRTVADELGSGVLFDLQSRVADHGAELSLGEELDRLADGDRYAPVLDWTHLEVEALVPGRNVFAPLADDGALEYLESTIEVVVIDDVARLEEARRVASGAVIRVAGGVGGGVEVVEVEEAPRAQPRPVSGAVAVVVAADPEDEWAGRVTEAVGDRPGLEVVAAPDPWATVTDADLVVVVERGVLPLPGCIDALAGTVAEGADVAATAKLFDASGGLAAAGLAVFADGSVAGIGEGCASVAAPWHEYRRDVWAAAGVLAVRGDALHLVSGASSQVVASARLWGGGKRVSYQPDASAVRVDQSTAAVDGPVAGIEEWSPALPACPERPARLDEDAWRSVLVRAEAEEAWR